MRHGRLAHLLGAAAFLTPLALAGCGNDAAPPPPPAQRAANGPRLVLAPSAVTDWQDVSAEIATVDEAQVLARIPGILTTLSVREGDRVRKGQTIGLIVDSQLGYQAGAYGAQAAAAQAQAGQAQAELARVRYLYRNGVYAKARLEQAEAAAAAAEAQIRAARAQQASVGALAGQGALVAPASGRVLRADVPAGAPVAPGMAVAVITAGPAILRLHLPESLAAKVRAGAAVRAEGLSAEAPGATTTGSVLRVYPAIAAGEGSADVAMAGIDDRLIGRRIAAQVAAGTRSALIVPARYVATRFGLDYVTVVARDGSSAQVPVQTTPGAEPGTSEILAGVAAGDVLVGPAS